VSALLLRVSCSSCTRSYCSGSHHLAPSVDGSHTPASLTTSALVLSMHFVSGTLCTGLEGAPPRRTNFKFFMCSTAGVRSLCCARPPRFAQCSATSQCLDPTGASGLRFMLLIAHVVRRSGDALRRPSVTCRGASVPRCHSPSLRSRRPYRCSARLKPELIDYVMLEILWRLGNGWETSLRLTKRTRTKLLRSAASSCSTPSY
jgi:hypothetical protein